MRANKGNLAITEKKRNASFRLFGSNSAYIYLRNQERLGRLVAHNTPWLS